MLKYIINFQKNIFFLHLTILNNVTIDLFALRFTYPLSNMQLFSIMLNSFQNLREIDFKTRKMIFFSPNLKKFDLIEIFWCIIH